jgi:hypothetical protein
MEVIEQCSALLSNFEVLKAINHENEDEVASSLKFAENELRPKNLAIVQSLVRCSHHLEPRLLFG